MSLRKCLLACLCLLVAVARPALAVQNVPDIIVNSRIDEDWSGYLVAKIRRYMIDHDLGDPFHSKVEAELQVADLVASNMVTGDTRRLVDEAGGMFGVQLVDAHSKITIKNFSYEITKITTDLRPHEKTSEGLVVDGTFSLSGMRAQADEIRIGLEIPVAGGKRAILAEVIIKAPYVQTDAVDTLRAEARFQVMEKGDELAIHPISSSFNDVARFLANRPQAVKLGYQDVIVPAVAIRIGGRVINLQADKVKAFLREREPQIKALMVDQLRNLLQQKDVGDLLAGVEKLRIPRTYWIGMDPLEGMYNVDALLEEDFNQGLRIDLQGGYCTKDAFDKYQKSCLQHPRSQSVPSRLRADNTRRSLVKMRDTLMATEGNAILSVSEDYINKIVTATYDAGAFDEMLKGSTTHIGPKKFFVQLNEVGSTATFYADVISDIKGWRSLVTMAGSVRFPLVCKMGMRFEKGPNGFPLLVFKMTGADLSDEVLKKGIRSLGLESTVNKVPLFRKEVLETIRSEVTKMIGKDVLTLETKDFKGLGLESMTFHSDGLGRAYTVLKLDALRVSAPEDAVQK